MLMRALFKSPGSAQFSFSCNYSGYNEIGTPHSVFVYLERATRENSSKHSANSFLLNLNNYLWEIFQPPPVGPLPPRPPVCPCPVCPEPLCSCPNEDCPHPLPCPPPRPCPRPPQCLCPYID